MPTDVATPLPQLDLSEASVVTVTLDDPGAVLISVTLHGWQEKPPLPTKAPEILLAVEPAAS